MAENGKQSMNPIAIISVHGVADQLPFDSARQISQMLLSHSAQQTKPIYQSFVETEFHIPESPLQVKPLEEKNVSTESEKGSLSSTDDNLNGFFNSLRLEGERHELGRGKSTPCTSQPIHIYEMYWADLSRLQNELFRIFSEFYQLLFHLSRIGRRTEDDLYDKYVTGDPVDSSRSADMDTPKVWNGYRFAQRWSERALTIGIPLLNVFMLVTALAIIPESLNSQYLGYIAKGSIVLTFGLLIGELVWRSPQTSGQRFKPSRILPHLIIIAFAGLCFVWDRLGVYHYVATLTGLLLAFIALAGSRSYNRRRPKAYLVAKYLSMVWALVFGGFLFFAENCQEGIIWACFRTIEVTFIPLLMCWFVFHICHILAAAFGYYLTLITCKEKGGIIHRGAWTARLSLSLSSALFLLVTLTLWYAIAYVSQDLIPKEIAYSPLIPAELIGRSITSASQFPKELIIAASSSLFTFVLVALLLTLLVGAIAFLPSIGAEIFRKTYTPDPDITHRFERWLTKGLTNVYRATEFFTLCMLLFSAWGIAALCLKSLESFPIEGLSHWASSVLNLIYPPEQLNFTRDLLGILVLIIASSATSLIALGSRLAKFTSGVRNLLDVVLDVDSYLRAHPKDSNPKQQIFKRYASLLRYICTWSAPDNPTQKYDAIIIIAHSQGTVITADFLRCLHQSALPQEPSLSRLALDYRKEKPTDPDPLPVYLYTMGSPLKQLYNMAFPSFYDWMDNLKELDDFGLKLWLNVYCSGDYVGRSLWYPPHQPSIGFIEESLGAGAHTHYWDNTIPKVAQKLDQLVTDICLKNMS